MKQLNIMINIIMITKRKLMNEGGNKMKNI